MLRAGAVTPLPFMYDSLRYGEQTGRCPGPHWSGSTLPIASLGCYACAAVLQREYSARWGEEERAATAALKREMLAPIGISTASEVRSAWSIAQSWSQLGKVLHQPLIEYRSVVVDEQQLRVIRGME